MILYLDTIVQKFTFLHSSFSCVVQSEDSFKLTNGKSVHSDLQKILTWKYYPRIIYPNKARFIIGILIYKKSDYYKKSRLPSNILDS